MVVEENEFSVLHAASAELNTLSIMGCGERSYAQLSSFNPTSAHQVEPKVGQNVLYRDWNANSHFRGNSSNFCEFFRRTLFSDFIFLFKYSIENFYLISVIGWNYTASVPWKVLPLEINICSVSRKVLYNY